MFGIMEGTVYSCDRLGDGCGGQVAIAGPADCSGVEGEEHGGGGKGLCLKRKASDEVCGGGHNVIHECGMPRMWVSREWGGGGRCWSNEIGVK